MLKLEPSFPTRKAREFLRGVVADMSSLAELSGINVYFDVDPM